MVEAGDLAVHVHMHVKVHMRTLLSQGGDKAAAEAVLVDNKKGDMNRAYILTGLTRPDPTRPDPTRVDEVR